MASAYYIYYRVDPERAALTETLIASLFASVRKSTNVQGRLLKKRNEPFLWMEVYERVPDPACFERGLAQAVEHLAIERYLPDGSSRKTECFMEQT
jgi:hypothetical protein